MSTSTTHHIPVLSTQSLSVGYVTKTTSISVVNHIDLHIQKGELISLVGINGSGKSTLIRTLAGLQPPLGGTILFKGKELHTINPQELATQIGVVLTGKTISKNLTVAELVALGRQPYTNWIGKLSKKDKNFCIDALEATEMLALKNEKCYALSDGQLQRALIARALAQNTELIILDEPTTHLDLHHKASILALLKKICKNTGKTILFSTHDIELVLPLCDTIIALHKNKAVANTPQHLINEGLFGRLFPDEIIGFDKVTQRFFIKK